MQYNIRYVWALGELACIQDMPVDRHTSLRKHTDTPAKPSAPIYMVSSGLQHLWEICGEGEWSHTSIHIPTHTHHNANEYTYPWHHTDDLQVIGEDDPMVRAQCMYHQVKLLLANYHF